ncbi:MAG: hypothetical protein SLAVMIC_00643 [uncultured marine phage]|uniref:Uncharacterized protein n=1 Tax=uncultured marine phage TaxID=707152 RepID=A0A8D9FR97_9VIRU|nr:MAG: hypothetical protein SLAVMIC_00643 [uncultured marine phage]
MKLNLNSEHIIDLVSQNPNNAELGKVIREYVSKNSKLKKYNQTGQSDPNQLSLDFGDQGHYEDVDEDEAIDLGDASSNLSVG